MTTAKAELQSTNRATKVHPMPNNSMRVSGCGQRFQFLLSVVKVMMTTTP